MTPQQAAQVLAAFHGGYPNQHIDGAVTAVWQNALQVVDYEAGLRAAGEWISTQRFWPTIAEFNGLCRRIQAGVDEPAGLPAANKLLTWDQARSAISRGYRSERERLGDAADEIDEKLERMFSGRGLVGAARSIWSTR
jgi:hypothetical protein